MATEIVEQAQQPALQAFESCDQSVFLSWMESLSDLMATSSNPSCLARDTLSGVGGLMHVLTCAAIELGERERKEMREAKA